MHGDCHACGGRLERAIARETVGALSVLGFGRAEHLARGYWIMLALDTEGPPSHKLRDICIFNRFDQGGSDDFC